MGELTATSKICKPCYLFHRPVLQQMKSDCTPAADTPEYISSDLEARTKQFEMKIYVNDKSFLEWNVLKMSRTRAAE